MSGVSFYKNVFCGTFLSFAPCGNVEALSLNFSQYNAVIKFHYRLVFCTLQHLALLHVCTCQHRFCLAIKRAKLFDTARHAFAAPIKERMLVVCIPVS